MADYLPPTEDLPQFNTAVFQSATQTLTLEEANNLYLGRIGTPNSIASATTFSGDITVPLINTANTIDIVSSTPSCNVDIGNGNLFNVFPAQANLAIGNSVIGGLGLLVGANNNVGLGNAALAGLTSGDLNVAIGNTVANGITTGNNNIAIGSTCSQLLTTGSNNVVIGNTANVAAIGTAAGVAIGNGAIAGGGCVSISSAGSSGSTTNSVAIGPGAARTTQGSASVAIGSNTANINQGANAIAIGTNAGLNNQQDTAVAIGSEAGRVSQTINAVAIGTNAGNNTQGDSAIAIGNGAGNATQVTNAVAIGTSAGGTNQAASAIAIGNGAGLTGQANHAIAIGTNAGGTIGQLSDAIAIGRQAGRGTSSAQGANSIAIGQQAGIANCFANSIVLNAQTATALNSTTATLWIKPLTTVAYSSAAGYAPLAWNSSSGEVSSITSSSLKTVGTLANTAMVSTTFYNYLTAGLSVPIGTYIVEIYAQASTTAVAGSITNFKAGLSTATGAFTAGTGGLQLLGTTSYPAVAGTPSGHYTTVLQNAAITTYYFVAQMTFTTIVPTTAAASSHFTITRIA